MSPQWLSKATSAFFTALITSSFLGQNPPPAQTTPALSPAPFITQLKKTIVFIQTDCERRPTTEDELAKKSELKQNPDAAKPLPKIESFVGTGFFLFFPDERIGPNQGFLYLITNRHVVQPGIEESRPCEISNYSIRLNLKDKTLSSSLLPIGKAAPWMFPSDPSVDLAALNISLDQDRFDFQFISADMFAASKTINEMQITEGDPVLFSGLFIQYFGQTRMEPIVRTGSLAMMPNEMLQTTLRKMGKVYLAEAHAFGGNSGSPMFVEVGGLRKGKLNGVSYKLLGIVAGEVFETANLEFHVATSYKGDVSANRGISMIVPAEELKIFLDSPQVKNGRENAAAAAKAKKP